MVRYLILDLDGTVADLSHRLHFIQGDKKDYDSFYAAVGDDAPIDSVIHVVRSLVDLGRDTSLGGYHCIVCTGRPERSIPATREWLRRHGLPSECDIFCRGDKDFRPDHVLKREFALELQRRGVPLARTIVFEDRKSCVDMWREFGCTVFQPADGNY